MGCPRLAAWGQAVLFLGGASGDSYDIFDSDHYLSNPAITNVKSFIGWRVISKFSKTKEHAEASFAIVWCQYNCTVWVVHVVVVDDYGIMCVH